jgi:hypothetical protein
MVLALESALIAASGDAGGRWQNLDHISRKRIQFQRLPIHFDGFQVTQVARASVLVDPFIEERRESER